MKSAPLVLLVLMALGTLAARADVDFSVACIERTPKCNRYQVLYTNYRPYLRAGTEQDQRWPNPGEPVTYRAHIYNGGTSAAICTYRWRTNGVVALTGSVPVAAKSFTNTPDTLGIAWPADGDRISGALAIDVLLNWDSSVAETSTTNNYEQITTRDLALSFFMSHEYFSALSARRNVWGTSNAVDWIRAQFLDMHVKFAQSIYPTAPQGILERVRIDRLVVVSNNVMQATLNADPYANNNDGRWQVWGNDPAGYAATFGAIIDYGLIHEVAHQLGLIDLYNNDVPDDVNIVSENGAPVLFRHESPQSGMMKGHGNVLFSEFCANALNRQLGRRRGYYGDFQFDLPRTNVIRVFDTQSNVLAGAQVRCYRRGTDGYFEDGNLLYQGATDAQGTFTLPVSGGGYATSNGFAIPPHPFVYFDVVGKNQILVQLSVANTGAFGMASFYYYIFDSINVNLAYWRGQTDTAHFDVYTKLNPNPGAPPPLVRVRHSGTTGTLALTYPGAPAGVTNRVYVTTRTPFDAPFALYQTTAGTSISVTRSDPARAFATVAGVYPGGQESSAALLALLPSLPLNEVWGIALLPGGHRLVCVRGNHEQPLWQTPDGRFIGMFSSEHNHLNPYDAAYDPVLQRVIMTDLPDGYAPNDHRIRVVTRWGKHVLMFGSGTGSADGQFSTPKGVTVDSSSRIYVADSGNNRVQAFTSGGAFLAKISGMSAPCGMSVDAGGRIWVADTGNNRVLALAWSGAALVVTGSITGLSQPLDVACGEDGSLFIAEATGNRIREYTNGALKAQYTMPTDGSSGALSRPQSVACLPGNHLVISDAGNRRVVELATQPGMHITEFLINGGAAAATSTNVTLRVTATANPVFARFGATAPEVLQGAWRAYAESYDWSIAPLVDVPQTLYAQVRNADGLTSDVASASIIYNPAAQTYVYVAANGNDANSGLSWAQAKASLQGAAQAGASNTVIFVGTGVFTSANNFTLDARAFGGSRIIGSGPARTVFMAPAGTVRFMDNLERAGGALALEGFRIVMSEPTARALYIGDQGATVALTLSNMWLTGPYDGDLPNGVSGTDGRRNGDAIYFSKWGGGGSASPYLGALHVSHSLFERWGGVMTFDDYQSFLGNLTCSFTRCTMVNCANTTSPGVDGSTFWLRGLGSNRWYHVRRCVISHCNVDAGCDGGVRLFSISSGASHMWCESNLISFASLPSDRVYMENAAFYTGEEHDINNVAPEYYTVEGRPYTLIALEPQDERGWYTVVPESGLMSAGVASVVLSCWRCRA